MPISSWKSGLQEIAPNVFAYIHDRVSWDICNSGFIVSDDGVMVIERNLRRTTPSPRSLEGRDPGR